jgi:hypothetical protein
MPAAFIPELSHSNFEVEDLANPLQSVSLSTVNPLQQTNGCMLNFLNVVRGEVNLDVKAGCILFGKICFLTSLSRL